jgi:hypothetical protein
MFINYEEFTVYEKVEKKIEFSVGFYKDLIRKVSEITKVMHLRVFPRQFWG